MLKSHVIDIDGRFVGVAIRLDQGFRFLAVDPCVEDLGEIMWPGIDDLRRMARRALALEHAPATEGRPTARRTLTQPAD